MIKDLASVGVFVPNIDSEIVDEVYEITALELNLRESLVKIEQRLREMLNYDEVMEVVDSVPLDSVRLAEQLWTDQGHDPEEDPYHDLYWVGLQWKHLLSQAPEITPENSVEEMERRQRLLDEWIRHIFLPTYDPTRPYEGPTDTGSDETAPMQALPGDIQPGPCGEYAMCNPDGIPSGDGTCASDNTAAHMCAGTDLESPTVCKGVKPGEVAVCKPEIPVDPNNICAAEFGSYMCDPTQLEPGSCIQLPGASPDCEFPVDFPWWVNCTGVMTIGCTQLPKGVAPPKGAKVNPFMPDPIVALG